MTHFGSGRFVGGWVVALALGLGACGGTVDLRGEDGGASGEGHVGGVGGHLSVGGGGAAGEHRGGTAGETSGVGGLSTGGGGGISPGPTLVTPGPVVEAPEPVVVDDGVVLGGDDLGKILAYDANPDGLGSAIYLTSLDATGCRHRLTAPEVQAKQPAFSHDGSRLAYAARNGGPLQIHVLDLETGVAQQVTDLPHGATSPSFSEDGTRLAFITGDPDAGGGAGGDGEFDVMVLDLEEQTQRVVLASTEGGCCIASNRAPTFFGNDELALSEHTALIAVDLNDFTRRDIMPSSGRIPMPRDPSMAPDAIRYAYSDYCGGLFGLYIGRVDGTSGDTCTGATKIVHDEQLFGADWGTFGKIAANRATGTYGLVLIDDDTLEASPLSAVSGAKNPSWGPTGLELPLTCQEPQSTPHE